MSDALVRFLSVGARKVSWEARLSTPITEAAIERAVARKRQGGFPVLMSRGIEAVFTDERRGAIYVGAVRRVGTFVIDGG